MSARDDYSYPICGGDVDTEQWEAMCDEIDRLQAYVPMSPNEMWLPSIDVCAFCADSECDGIACIASLDPDNQDDHETIERLHALLRAGAAFLQASEVLARAENR